MRLKREVGNKRKEEGLKGKLNNRRRNRGEGSGIRVDGREESKQKKENGDNKTEVDERTEHHKKQKTERDEIDYKQKRW
jgi:hypothetical protein